MDTVRNHLIIVRPFTFFCIENMSSYMLAIVRAIYSYLVYTHLMTAFILIQLTLPVKTNVNFVFALSDPIFRIYMQKGYKFDIFDLFVVMNDILVSIRQLMNTIIQRASGKILTIGLSYPL